MPDGPDIVLDTSLMRFVAGGGSSLSNDMMLEVLRGSGGRGFAVVGAGAMAYPS